MFSRARIAVFCDGCYWHGCPDHGTWPKANSDWWRQKIETTKLRDSDTNERLRSAGWLVIRVWEHEPVDDAVERIAAAVSARRAANARGTR